MIKLLGLGPLG